MGSKISIVDERTIVNLQSGLGLTGTLVFLILVILTVKFCIKRHRKSREEMKRILDLESRIFNREVGHRAAARVQNAPQNLPVFPGWTFPIIQDIFPAPHLILEPNFNSLPRMDRICEIESTIHQPILQDASDRRSTKSIMINEIDTIDKIDKIDKFATKTETKTETEIENWSEEDSFESQLNRSALKLKSKTS